MEPSGAVLLLCLIDVYWGSFHLKSSMLHLFYVYLLPSPPLSFFPPPGYLDWLRNRGFCEMFIWACPPMQGDDYILYCHPTRQKNPKSDRLREWYLRMLRKAQADGVIHHCTNMFDRYFDGGREHRLPEVSMGQVPYYEGDYWPGEAENLLDKIGEEGRTQGKKAAKGRPKTAQTAKGKRGAGPATTDEQLMARLGETISQMREDFIVVHFRPTCSFCRKYFNGEIAFFAPQHLPPTVRRWALLL